MHPAGPSSFLPHTQPVHPPEHWRYFRLFAESTFDPASTTHLMKTILVVEEHAFARRFICWTLQRSGYCTLDVESAEEAYNALTHYRGINLVLSDFDIPGDSGFDLLRTIKSNPLLGDM